MKLYPALRINGEVIKGKEDDSHNTLAMSKHLPKPSEDVRGFSPDGKLFLSRKQALGWLKSNDIATFRKLPGKAHYSGLHSEHLAKAYGITQKPEAVEIRQLAKNAPNVAQTSPQKVENVDLSTKTVLVYDRGLYLYLAEKLAETYKKVLYYLPSSDPYPTSKLYNIGTGLKNVQRVYDFWSNVDKADLLVFFDCYDGELQHFLREKGYVVFGTGRGEKVETDKVFFLECLEEVGLPCPTTYRAEGLDDLLQYLQKSDDEKWLKTSYYRGDFETKRYRNMAHLGPWVDDLKRKLGKRVDEIEVLVQDKIESACEAGYDGFCVDGQFTGNCFVGYEMKDKGLIAKVVEEPAPIIKYVNDKFSLIFKKLGYRGHYSTEIRITEDGTPYFIDPTCRVPSPPGELMSLMYENYAECIWEIANGRVPVPKPKAKYGAQVVITSDWYREGHEMCVEFPTKYKENIKLSNHFKRDGKIYVTPNETEEYFGSVVAIGNSVKEATEKVLEILETIDCEKLRYDHNVFADAAEAIECGKKFGITF